MEHSYLNWNSTKTLISKCLRFTKDEDLKKCATVLNFLLALGHNLEVRLSNFKLSLIVKPKSFAFNDQCSHRIETSQLICSANQLTLFYMMGTLVVKRLTSA